MSKEKSFGIGCFHFGIQKKPPFQFKGSEYIEELKNDLSKIPSLNNLKIKTDRIFKSYSEEITEALPNLESDEGCFPHALSFILEFELFIPFRIQKEIVEERKLINTFSENFKVKILHGYYLPVAIIEIKNPTRMPDPSMAVRIVREFLEKELKNNAEYIRFECIGPSPFHLDCSLKPQKSKLEDTWIFNPIKKSRIGYDELIINYNENILKNSDEALKYLILPLMIEFSFFYMCIQTRNSKMRLWELIQDDLEKLILIQKSSGIKGFFKKLLKRSALIESLITDVTMFEAENIYDKIAIQNSYNQIYSSENEILFKTFIDRELDEKNVYPTTQTVNLITFFESKRIKNLELIIAIFAAMLGGAIGALLII
ncbi:hypothetical protein KAT63_01535 [Candidatus Parcubacteria bacterium]|nr:hypothetical protein [Candidatus Parcubacteria bacterium]